MNKHYLRIVWVIAKNNYQEIIRTRLLYGVFCIALLVTGSSFFLATISLDQNSRVLQNIGLASIHLFALFICIFVATNSIRQDFERRTLYLLFSKPISRSQYVLGKFSGIVLLLITTLLLLGGLFLLGAWFVDHSLVVGGLINLGYSFLEISLLSAIAILFSTFTSPLNAALYSISFFIIGHSLTTLKEYVTRLGSSFTQQLINACYYLLPNLDKFDVRRSVLYGIHIPAESVAWSVVYWIVYLSIILWLAIWVMKNEEI